MLLRGFHHWFLHMYTSPSCLPGPSCLVVPARPGVVEAAPALPLVSEVRLPPASAACCDRPQVGLFPPPGHVAPRGAPTIGCLDDDVGFGAGGPDFFEDATDIAVVEPDRRVCDTRRVARRSPSGGGAGRYRRTVVPQGFSFVWLGWLGDLECCTLDPSRRGETPTFRTTIDHSGGWGSCAPYWRPSHEQRVAPSSTLPPSPTKCSPRPAPIRGRPSTGSRSSAVFTSSSTKSGSTSGTPSATSESHRRLATGLKLPYLCSSTDGEAGSQGLPGAQCRARRSEGRHRWRRQPDRAPDSKFSDGLPRLEHSRQGNSKPSG